ncbi:MAG: response regulator [Spirochaetales bacterium]|nr:response regulator [Spirochaetales bacterium]
MSPKKSNSEETSALLKRILAVPFLSNLTHELRTPLNSIVGMTKLSLEVCAQPELHEYLSILDESVDQLAGLMNLLIEYFNISTNSVIFHPRDVVLEDFILDSLKHLFVVAEAKKLVVSVYFHPDLPRSFYVDPDRLRLIVEQLVDNGIKFTSTGSIFLRFSYNHQTSVLEFSVIDEGIGIEEQDLSRIFGAFEQEVGDYNRHFGGAGLGLTIANFLSKSMGGSLEVTSKKNQGTRVDVCLPLPIRDGQIVADELKTVEHTRWIVVSRSVVFHEYFRNFVGDLGLPFRYIDGRELSQYGTPESTVVFLDFSLPISEELKSFVCDRKGLAIRVTGFSTPRHIDSLGAEIPLVPGPLTPKKVGMVLTQKTHPRLSPPILPKNELNGAKILVIEDDAINLLTVVRLLEKKGALVYQAGHVLRGLELLTEHHPDLALVDIGLPTISGFEFVRAVRQGDARGIPTTFPVLALTAYSSQEDHARMKKAGFRDILVKPYHPEKLAETIAKVLENMELVPPAEQGRKIQLLNLLDTMDFHGLEKQVNEEIRSFLDNAERRNEWFKLLLVARREDPVGIREIVEKMEREGYL